MPSVSRCELRSSAKTPAPPHPAADAGHDVGRGQDSCGFQGARAAKSGTGSCEIHLREVSMCVCSKKGGSALFAKRRHHGPVGLDTGDGAEPLLHVKRHVRLAKLCTGLSWLVVTSTIASSRWLVASRFCCHARDVILHGNVFCDCGHRELHRLPTLPPRWWIWPQLFTLRSMASMS